MRRVSFQGEHGAYSEGAAGSFFGGKLEAVPYPTFSEALQSTACGRTDFAVLPVENSLEGTVGESIDLLYSTPLSAVGEIYHKIEHCLIGYGSADEVETVYSHPQALGQCRGFIQKRGIKTLPTYDTAGSAGMVKGLNRKDAACIASRNASEIYGVPVIMEGIADEPNNYTRFLVLSRDSLWSPGSNKTSIIFSIKHEPGALYGIIRGFYENGINLTKIESRPKRGTAWEYNFYVDFEGSSDDEKIARMLDGIKEHSLFFKILGSYPMAGRASP